MSKLRGYQLKIINEARHALKTHKSILIQGATGMGKTVLSSFMLKSLAAQNKSGLFICHRRELIKQTSDSFNEFGINHSIVAAGYKLDINNPIQICSVLSLIGKMKLLKNPDFIIWDECHHIAANTWNKIFDYFEDAHHIGLTATPQRLDGKGLGKFFEKIISAPPMRELINQGYLSDFDIYAPSQIDLSNVNVRRGDYDLEQLEKSVNKRAITGCAIEHYKKLCNNKKAIVFCASIKHSLDVVKKFNDSGIKSAHIDGSMTNKERDRLIDDFKNGILSILSNVDIISEGFDLPSIETAILLRPTQSLTLYLQQIGRALRRSDEKDRAIILDHSGNCLAHGMPDVENEWDLNPGKKWKRNRILENIIICPMCNMANNSKDRCSCGYFLLRKRNVVELTGELQKINNENRFWTRKKFKDEDVIRFLKLYNDGNSMAYSVKSVFKTIDSATISVMSRVVKGEIFTHLTEMAINKKEWMILNFNKKLHGSYKKNKNNCFITNLFVNKSGSIQLCFCGKQIDVKRYLFKKNRPLGKSHVLKNKCNEVKCINPEHFISIKKSEIMKKAFGKVLKRNPNFFVNLGKMSYLKRKETGNNLNPPPGMKPQKIKVINIMTQKENYFDSPKQAIEFIACSISTFRKYIKSGAALNGYIIKKYLPF